MESKKIVQSINSRGRNFERTYQDVLPSLSLFEKISNSLIFEEKFTPHLVPPPRTKCVGKERRGEFSDKLYHPLTCHNQIRILIQPK